MQLRVNCSPSSKEEVEGAIDTDSALSGSTKYFQSMEMLNVRSCYDYKNIIILQGMSSLRSLIPFRLSHQLKTSACV